MRLLIVEDDPVLQSSLAEQLREAGHVVDTAGDGKEGLYFAEEFKPDLAIIDLGLPVMSGMDLIRVVREKELSFPILILTARDRWQEKVDGLSAGADDYLTKPFQLEELIARVNALIRRAAGFASSVISCGLVSMDTSAQKVTVAGAEVVLTAFEYRLLECLMLSAGRVISKAELTDRLYDQDFERDSNVIEVLVGRLRRKLDPENSINPIETLRGRGYRFNVGTAD
ncbi:MAG: response regulator [Gammaproteobacteria bacterium]|nr:response regulator [Gammaproteobacteria bacterium]MCZ6763082.1 response regulator [Gammaproteobacteria bacterium]